MSIQVGDQIPQGTVKVMTADGPQDLDMREFAVNRKVVIFAVPGAFTPGCSLTHLPGFVAVADKIKTKGVDAIMCLAVNDVFVMDAWGKSQNADEIVMAADGSATYTKALGLEFDGSNFGMGVRSKRYAMIVEDGKVTYLGVDAKSIEQSSADTVLEKL